ncbi:FkbM family methyltransferase [bacterium]|nr:FkbM family methyltransferase [bacterium]
MIRSLIPFALRKSIRGFEYCWRIGLGRHCLAALHSSDSLRFIGSEYGGWWVPDSVLTVGGDAICCGCGTDVSFDLILAHVYGFNVRSLDPTPNSASYVSRLVNAGSSLKFESYGIYSRRTKMKFFPPASLFEDSYSISNIQDTENPLEFEVITISEIVDGNGRDPAILKMDIEGAEVAVLFNLLKSECRPSCILVEFDELAYPTAWRLAKIRVVCRMLLRSNYKLFRASGSNFCFQYDSQTVTR